MQEINKKVLTQIFVVYDYDASDFIFFWKQTNK